MMCPSASKNILNLYEAFRICGQEEPIKMPRMDFHTEWAMPDPADYEDVGSDERKPVAPMVLAPEMESGLMRATPAPKPQTKEKWFITGGPAY